MSLCCVFKPSIVMLSVIKFSVGMQSAIILCVNLLRVAARGRHLSVVLLDGDGEPDEGLEVESVEAEEVDKLVTTP